MKFQVTNSRLALLKDDTLVQNSTDTYTATFLFNEDWDGFTKTVNFVAGPADEDVPLTGDSCTIPASCLTQGGIYLHVRVYGYKDNELIQTNWQISRILYPTNTVELASSSLFNTLSESIALLREEHQKIQEALDELQALVEAGGGTGTGLEYASDEEVEEMIKDTIG